ncbi:hypothetical protein NDA14_000758 [Ustilago hordei]|nr:hypothetical protein NDA10_003949 [Ustilago hordei]KAJ1587376.1 hypothetical protein NDA15_004966 [Ustilago hordei]KAJ1602021.1 hypothetical protein NDA14_000758 [Ustilago hordei]UTT96283.1 hypothetical protein NDA17_001868 [Ustilago hordei]
MKTMLRSKSLAPVARLHSSRTISSSSSPSSSSRAAALAKAAQASATASERLSARGPSTMGPSYNSRQKATSFDAPHRLLSEHDEASAQYNLSSSQTRRSRAARFGTSRHATYASPLLQTAASDQTHRTAEENELEDEEQLALAYASPTGTSTSSIYLPEYVAWAISQLIAAANDPKLVRADHLKLAHLTDPQQHMAEAAHIPPKRSSLLHLATVSPHRYAAILAVLSEVRQRLYTTSPVEGSEGIRMEEALPSWTPDTVLDFDCAAGEGLWAAAQVFRQGGAGSTSVKHYHGYDRRPNLLKSGKKVAQSSASNVSPTGPKKPEREMKLKDEGEQIQVDGVTYYEQGAAVEQDLEEKQAEEVEEEYFSGPKSAMALVEKTFQSVPLAKDLASAGSAGRSLAISAFALSLMTNDSNRVEAVQAMWNSGAQVIVIIDRSTPRGFASVASARAQLLQLGKQTQAGAHVVAPCSHDKPCPLLHPFAINSSVAAAVGVRSDTGNPAKSKDVCSFTARYHTPTFLRKTKDSDRGEENVGYSYVVVRRGVRPSLVGEAQRRLASGEKAVQGDLVGMVEQLAVQAGRTKTGILDLIRSPNKATGEWRTLEEVGDSAATLEDADGERGEGEMSDEQAMDQLLKLLPDALKAEMQTSTSPDEQAQQLTPEQLDSIMASLRSSSATTTSTSSSAAPTSSTSDLQTVSEDGKGMIIDPAPTAQSELAMRLESYSWPRLIKAPLKKGGHVTLDACCASGNIERFTISKASGKQAYQDARKSKWGDLFPHPPRSRSVVKVLNPLTALEYQQETEADAEVELDGLPLEEVDLMDRLTLRAPSKLNSATTSKANKGIQILGLEGEDADSILAELFSDLPPSSSSPTTSSKGANLDRGIASYRLISPNLVTPTKKQEKRLHINYAKKWDPNSAPTPSSRAAAARLANSNTNLSTRPTLQASGGETAAELGEDDAEAGFQSSLQSLPPSGAKMRRSSRKKSRGDWDFELFGHSTL